MVIGPESYGISLETVKKISEFNWGFFNVEIVLHILVIRGAGKVLKFIYSEKNTKFCEISINYLSTAIPYRVITGWKQGFPCEVFPHREKPVFITWNPCNENRLLCVLIAPAEIYIYTANILLVKNATFPCEKNFAGKTLFSLQGWVCSVFFLTLL